MALEAVLANYVSKLHVFDVSRPLLANRCRSKTKTGGFQRQRLEKPGARWSL